VSDSGRLNATPTAVGDQETPPQWGGAVDNEKLTDDLDDRLQAVGMPLLRKRPREDDQETLDDALRHNIMHNTTDENREEHKRLLIGRMQFYLNLLKEMSSRNEFTEFVWGGEGGLIASAQTMFHQIQHMNHLILNQIL